ncbi:hypothetical protein ACJQWK_02297 [Exserohilum turcicum]
MPPTATAQSACLSVAMRLLGAPHAPVPPSPVACTTCNQRQSHSDTERNRAPVVERAEDAANVCNAGEKVRVVSGVVEQAGGWGRRKGFGSQKFLCTCIQARCLVTPPGPTFRRTGA